MSNTRVYIGMHNGIPVFRIGPPGQAVLDTPEGDLLFSEKYSAGRIICRGVVDLPSTARPALTYLEYTGSTHDTLYAPTFAYGKTLSRPPEADAGRYYPAIDAIRLPIWAMPGPYFTNGSSSDNRNIYGGINLLCFAGRDAMRLGFQVPGGSSGVGWMHMWTDMAVIEYLYGPGGKIGACVWDVPI